MSKRNIFRYFCFVVLITVLLCSGLGRLSDQSAFALTGEGYSFVLDDLSLDPTFKASDYPYVADLNSIQVIQVAVSEKNELFVYTYQPSQATRFLTASEINLTFAYDPDPCIYQLELVSYEGTLCKYKVATNYVPNRNNPNYINITSISRLWNRRYDDPPVAGTTTNTIAYPVGQVWRITYSNNKLVYEMEQTDVVTIIDPFVDFLQYEEGLHRDDFFNPYATACRSHYVAFSTDHQIDDLTEAVVQYVERSATHNLRAYSLITYGEPEVKRATLLASNTQSSDPHQFFYRKHTWNSIQSVDTFKQRENLTAQTISALDSSQWIIRFATTPVTFRYPNLVDTYEDFTDISEVEILLLTFVTAGKTYSLGTVSNKVTGDLEPGNKQSGITIPSNPFEPGNDDGSFWDKISEWFSQIFDKLAEMLHMPKWAVIAIAVVLGVIILGIVLSTFFPNVVLPIIKTLFEAIFWILSLPFKLLAALIERLRS